MTDIEWDKKDLNQGKDNSGVANIKGLTGADKGIKQGYTQGSLTKGLVTYYPMERGKGQVTRDAALNNTGQIKGANWTEDSQIGNYSLDFDGAGEKVVHGNNRPKITGSLSFSTWFYARQDESERQEIYQIYPEKWHIRIDERGDEGFGSPGNNFGPGIGLHIQRDSDGLWYVVSTSVPTEGWHHLTATFNKKKMKLYLDGLEVDNYDFGIPISIKQELLRDTDTIGALDDGSNDYKGKLSELRVYNRALSQKEVKALYELTRSNGVEVAENDVPSEEDDGVSRWKFDDDLDTDTAVDSWGSNDGSIEGAVYTGQRVYGSNAMSFDGDGSFVDTGLNTDELESPTTFALWFKPESDGRQTFLTGYLSGSSNRWDLEFDRQGEQKISWLEHEDSNVLTSQRSLELNQWHQLTVTHNLQKGFLRFYTNGKLDGQFSIGRDLDSSVSLGIASRTESPDDFPFNGIIDDVRVYDSALTPLQVEKLFKKGAYRINRGDTVQ